MSSETTPVDADQNAQLGELLHRAQQDFAAAESVRQDTCNEDRVHGSLIGGN